MAAVLGMPFMDIVHGLRLASSTIRRRQAKGELLALDESERTLGLIRLIGQVQDMVERAGDPTGFDAGLWVRDWLLNPSPALGGEKPLAYLSSSAGQQVLSDLLMRNLTGAYS
jgi:putative toxin-antitoxin system antitoxin component (TIGR02293 family)